MAALVAASCASGASGCGSPPPAPAEPLAPISLAPPSSTDVRSRVDQLVQPIIERGLVAGMAIVVIRDEQVLFMGYGRISTTHDRRPSPDTLFEIGEVGEVLAGLLVADMAARRELDLDRLLAQEAGDSGVPSMLRLAQLQTQEFRMPVAELLARRVARPLGMDSVMEPAAAPAERMAQGHDLERAPIPPRDEPAPVGDLVASSRDLAMLLGAHLHRQPERLGTAVALAETARFGLDDALDQPGTRLGLGWYVRPDGSRMRRSMTEGFSTWVAYHRGDGIAVAILASTAAEIVAQLGDHLMDGLRGRWQPIDFAPAR